MQNKVELIGYYGGDESHSLSAWTSTSRDLTDEKRERMPQLLHFLAKEGHHTPFEKSSLHFLVTCDTASHIHLLKHRIGVSINAESARYKALSQGKWHVPSDWDFQHRLELEEYVMEGFEKYHNAIESLVEAGVDRKRAKESARFFLPYAFQVTIDVMFNFRSFMHFQGLRNDEHAQVEIREIAQEMLELVKSTGAFDESLKGFGYA